MQIDAHLKTVLIEHNKYSNDQRVTCDFVAWVGTQNKNTFRRIITALPTRKIHGSETLLNRTLNFSSPIKAFFLCQEMLKHGELDHFEKARLSQLLSSPLIAPKSEKKKRAIQHLRALFPPQAQQENGFNYYVFSMRSIADLIAVQRIFGEAPALESFLAGIASHQPELILKSLESRTQEEVQEVITFKRLNPPCKFPIFGGGSFEIEKDQNAFDVLLKYRHLEVLESLLQLCRTNGMQDLVDLWLKNNPIAQVHFDNLRFCSIAAKVVKREESILYRPKKTFAASHLKETKEDRKQLQFLLKNILDIALKGDAVKNPKSPERVLTFHFKNETNPYRLHYDFGTSPVYLEHQGHIVSVPSNLWNVVSHPNLHAAFNGDQIEQYYLESKEKAHPIDFWNDWEERLTARRLDYRSAIHPAIRTAVSQMIPKMRVVPTVLDICGGKGALGHSIITMYKANYILLENNEPSLKAARELLPATAAVIKTDVVKDTNYYTDEGKRVPLKNQSVDIVIASGALSHNVMPNKEAALIVLRKIHRYLKSGGYFIMASMTEPFLNSEDLKARGFNVLNMSLLRHWHPFYVAQKR